MNFTVDACVIRASGNGEHEVATACRDALQALSKAKSRILFCPVLRNEWARHASRFGTAWLASMASKGLMRPVPSSSVHANGVQRAIAALPPQEVPVAEKDAHLVVAGVAANSIVVSLEVNSRNKFHSIWIQYQPIGGVVWLNPKKHSPHVVPFIEGDGLAGPWQLSMDDP